MAGEREREHCNVVNKGGKLNNNRVSTNMVESRDLGEGDVIFFFSFHNLTTKRNRTEMTSASGFQQYALILYISTIRPPFRIYQPRNNAIA